MSSTSLPPAGWYPDPADATGLKQRYWDGKQWTHEVRAATPAPAAPPEPGLTLSGSEPAATAAPTEPATTANGAARIASDKQRKVPMFGARKAAQQLQEELTAAQQSLEALGGLEYAQIQQAINEQRLVLAELTVETHREQARLYEARSEIVATEETQILQEVGVYEYRHPLTDAAAYQGQLKQLQDSIKTMARKDGGAVSGDHTWTVNGSAAQGRKMVGETGKLMLRAYNAEADNLVRGLKPYKLDSATARLTKVRETITRLGRTMGIDISPAYHQLRVKELELTADYLAKKEEEKEREREERERLREERKAQQEMERERKRLEKEQAHYLNALKALEAKGDEEAATRLREQLVEIEKAIEDVDYRAANIRAGYVYVISNIGAFGEDVVKVGLTRRLDPLDRVRELGDASVPFRYDTHALFFAEDAVGIEQQLHERLAAHRINRVNLRREFFRVSPSEVKTHLLDLAGDILEFTDVPEALEYRQSLNLAEASGEASPASEVSVADLASPASSVPAPSEVDAATPSSTPVAD